MRAVEEFGGSFADLGTLIPVVMVFVAVLGFNLSTVLFFFGLSYILAGLWFKQLMPVQPMKTIAAIAIAGGLTAAEVTSAGLIMAAIFLTLGLLKIMKHLEGRIPQGVVRGIQLGAGLILIRKALEYIGGDVLLGMASIGIVSIFLAARTLNISALILLALGATLSTGSIPPPTFALPLAALPPLPSADSLITASWRLVLPQLPLTIANSVLAISLLSNDLLKKKTNPDKLATSVGALCLISAPLGGLPTCHGSGGLAAHHRFGARTEKANYMIGTIFVASSFFVGSVPLSAMIPLAILGVMLLFAGGELCWNGLKSRDIATLATMGVTAILLDPSMAIPLGLLAALVIHVMRNKGVLFSSGLFSKSHGRSVPGCGQDMRTSLSTAILDVCKRSSHMEGVSISSPGHSSSFSVKVSDKMESWW